MMNRLPAKPMREIDCTASVIPDGVLNENTPVILRGLVSHWPMVRASLESYESAVEHILSFYQKQAIPAFLAHKEAKGRFFYNDTVDGFNFIQTNVHLDEVLNKLLELQGELDIPTYYVGSLEIGHALPGFLDNNDIDIPFEQIRKSIWLGNRSLVATHYDFPDNIACCVLGKRRFTLFPPEQLENLYVGPIDLTPAGQQISMVNIREPDLTKYPRFSIAMESALEAELEPGDALYVPSMWWHNVESLSDLNGLVNYWWRSTPEYMDSPNNPLLHALMSIKGLPERQRKAWQNLFNYYVFEQPDGAMDHLPENARGRLGDFNEMMARQLRAQLLNNLK